jgi:hypothetical protein
VGTDLAAKEVAEGQAKSNHTGALQMRAIRTTAIAFVVTMAVTACSKGDVESADTTTIPGIDTTAGMALPTTDTVVKTTTTDTLRGEVPRDSVKKDTTKKSPY